MIEQSEAQKNTLHGSLDVCDERGIGGWIIDPEQPELALQIDILIDYEFVTRITANIFRQDLVDANIGKGCCAFYMPMPEKYFDGHKHSIEIIESARGWELPEVKIIEFYLPNKTPSIALPEDMGGGEVLQAVAQAENIPEAPILAVSPAAAMNIRGSLDLCDQRGIRGWINDVNNPEQSLSVDIFIDDELITTESASFFRQDLLDADIGDGCSAFASTIPARFFDGQPHIVALGINGEQVAVANTPLTVTLAPDLLANEQQQDSNAIFGLPVVQEVPPFIADVTVFTDKFMLIIGWTNDLHSPIKSFTVSIGEMNIKIASNQIYRYRRTDVEEHLQCLHPAELAFWCLVHVPQLPSATFDSTINVFLESGQTWGQGFTFTRKAKQDVFNMALPHLLKTEVIGHPTPPKLSWLDNQLGANFLALNTMIVNDYSDHIVTEYSRGPRKYKQSIVIVLYGKIEYLFLQLALFSNNNEIKDTQFIYVINSPELTEPAHREAKIALRLYGLSIFIVQMKGNVGFSVGNNVGVQYAQSDRILIVNPDVFPKHKDWLVAHNHFAMKHPKSIFGARLYYDDGSVMHAGMYFEKDSVKYSFNDENGGDEPYLVRVEHYCKGAPDNIGLVEKSRKVPAVTGAFMSCDRKLFEKVEGFSRGFIFGHYEDADLCLKFNQIGSPVWYAGDIKLWHLEGKGSGKNEFLGSASFINRWSFTRKWGENLPYGIDVQL